MRIHLTVEYMCLACILLCNRWCILVYSVVFLKYFAVFNNISSYSSRKSSASKGSTVHVITCRNMFAGCLSQRLGGLIVSVLAWEGSMSDLKQVVPHIVLPADVVSCKNVWAKTVIHAFIT